MQEVTQYKSNRGKVYDNAFDALKDDLLFCLEAHCGNGAVAQKASDSICETPEMVDALYGIVYALRDHHPDQPKLDLRPPVNSALEKRPDAIIVDYGKSLIRCIGGSHCDHSIGTCTATARHAKPGEAVTPQPYKDWRK